VLSYQVDELIAAKKLRVILEAFEPAAIPIHVIQLPGIQNRAATAFADFSVEQLKSRLKPVK
jgi:hypothetical protein